MTRVLFVCLGNICRSPMAEFVLKDMVNRKDLSAKFLISSAATSGYNEANQEEMHDGTKQILSKRSIPYTKHISHQIKKEDYENFDYILCMDEKNVENVLKIIGTDPDNKVWKLLDFTEEPRDIIDPWYSGDFDATYSDISHGCEKFLEYICKQEGEPYV